MKIAMMNEFSQASKNAIVLAQLKDVVEPMGHTVYNTGMECDDDPHYLTYLNRSGRPPAQQRRGGFRGHRLRHRPGGPDGSEHLPRCCLRLLH